MLLLLRFVDLLLAPVTLCSNVKPSTPAQAPGSDSNVNLHCEAYSQRVMQRESLYTPLSDNQPRLGDTQKTRAVPLTPQTPPRRQYTIPVGRQAMVKTVSKTSPNVCLCAARGNHNAWRKRSQLARPQLAPLPDKTVLSSRIARRTQCTSVGEKRGLVYLPQLTRSHNFVSDHALCRAGSGTPSAC